MNRSEGKRILILDDQPDLIKHYVAHLSHEGYVVSVVTSSAKARSVFANSQIDIAILDANLLPSTEIEKIKIAQRLVGDEPFVEEEGEGYRVAAWLRGHYPATGSIILSSERTEADDRITGLDCGADDYVLKSVPAAELSSRVRALARRLAPPAAKTIGIGHLSLQLEQGTLTAADGKSVKLTVSQLKLLKTLAEKPVRSRSRAELYRSVFGVEIPSQRDRSIDNLVSKLRSKVSDELNTKLSVSTIYGGGYLVSE